LHDALGGMFARERICPQRFNAPLAPPVAARLQGKTVDAALLRSGIDWWRERADFLVVEGAGGLLSPLTESECVADLAVSCGLPLIIVARLSLGTINHTLLTIEAAHSRDLAIAGIILNQPAASDDGDRSVASNPEELQRRCAAPIVAILPPSNLKVRFFVNEATLPALKLGDPVTVSCDGCGTGIAAKITFIARTSEFTPPVIYSVDERSKLVFLIEARTDTPERLRVGQPVSVVLGQKAGP